MSALSPPAFSRSSSAARNGPYFNHVWDSYGAAVAFCGNWPRNVVKRPRGPRPPLGRERTATASRHARRPDVTQSGALAGAASDATERTRFTEGGACRGYC
jgi:hypothetical protein